MISYRISEQDLLDKIDAHDPGWRAKAKFATDTCAAAGEYVAEIPKNPATGAKGRKLEGLWSDIKDVFMDLQFDKCCYCERKLASKKFGKIEHDIEHFRPKSRVKNWFTAEVKQELPDWPAALGQSGAKTKGYHLLPFAPLNYATSCKECNSTLKSDYFPCASDPVLDSASPAAAAAEQPWLIFPVGELDEPAESLIKFEGLLAQPAHDETSDQRRHWRARVTIRFFQLNIPSKPEAGAAPSQGRENLYRERAEAISSIAYALDSLENATTAARRARDEKKIKRLIAADSPHTNCSRSFLKLWSDSGTRSQALKLWDDVEEYLDSIGRTE